MTQTEALKLALEALEKTIRYASFHGADWAFNEVEEAITDIKEVLEQPAVAEQHKQEPQPPYKFERYVSGSLRAQGVMVERATKLADAMRIAAKICPPANPPSAPTVLVYTTPPQRTWVGLTKKEVYDLYDSDYAVFHQRIEAKLKEKNT